MLWNAVVPGLALLGLVIFVHELGHFLMAKWRGVKVIRFSLGFGPAIVKLTRGETEYQIAWIPLGGYVQMAGDSPGADGSMGTGQEEFLSHPWFGRLLIAAAGPAANLVTAFLVMVTVGLVGVSYPDHPNQLGATPDTSVAYSMGLREGDRIVALDGQAVKSWVAIFFTNSHRSSKLDSEVRVERGTETFAVKLAPEQREPFFSSLQRPSEPPVVGSVVTGMPAYKAGLREGDLILSVNGQRIQAWEELPKSLRGQVDRDVTLRVSRGGQEFDISLRPINPQGADRGNGMIGIGPPQHSSYVERFSVLQSLQLGVRATGALVASVYGGMWMTVSRPLYYREYLGGPIFIAQAASEQARRGLDSYLQFLAMINIAIMAFNLLPLPVLDGGHILLALVEALRRQAISARSYLRFQKVGLAFMAALLLMVMANDPLRLLQRQRALDRSPRLAPQEQPIGPP